MPQPLPQELGLDPANKDVIFANACSILGPIPGLPFTPIGHDISPQLDDQHQQDAGDHQAAPDPRYR